jgi:hypothetical protein
MRDYGIGRRFTVRGANSLTSGSDFQLFQLDTSSAGVKNGAKLVRLRMGIMPAIPSDEFVIFVRIARNFSSSAGSGSSTFNPINSTDATNGVLVNGTGAGTALSGGTFDDLIEDTWNTRYPYDLNMAPDEAPYIQNASRRFCIQLGTTPLPSGSTLRWTTFFEVYE